MAGLFFHRREAAPRLHLFALAVGALLLAGCATRHSYSLSVGGTDGSGAHGGIYYLADCPDAKLRTELLTWRDGKVRFVARPQPDAMRLSLAMGAPVKDHIGFWSYANNFLSAVTLGLIPWRPDDCAVQTVQVQSDDFTRRIPVRVSSMRSWGRLPLPLLGIGDVAILVGGTVVGVACFLVEPFAPFAGIGAVFLENTAENAGQASQYLRQHIDYPKLASSIARSLKQRDYQNFLAKGERQRQAEERKRQEEERVRQERIRAHEPFRKAHELVDFDKLKERDTVLRSFALRNHPEVWAQLQEARMELDFQEEQCNHHEDELLKLGRKPEEEPQYRAMCQKRIAAAKHLLQLYARLEELFLASQTGK